jgi:DNA polymerase II
MTRVPTRVAASCGVRIRRLRAEKCDLSLAWRRSLRRPVEEYTGSSPPNARAALMPPPEERTGLIRYVWTLEGLRSEARRTAPPDYNHYVEKQIQPIMESIAPYVGLRTEGIFAPGGQLGLFRGGIIGAQTISGFDQESHPTSALM